MDSELIQETHTNLEAKISVPLFSSNVKRLLVWFCMYLVLFFLGICLFVLIEVAGARISDIAWIIVLLCIVSYIGSIVYSYKVQKELNRVGLSKRSADWVIIGAAILNPIAGSLIPLLVLGKAQPIRRRLNKKQDPTRTESDIAGR